jgi:hypothetical protein
MFTIEAPHGVVGEGKRRAPPSGVSRDVSERN